MRVADGRAREGDDVEQLRGVGLDRLSGDAGHVVGQVPVVGVGEDVAGRVQAGRALLLALVLDAEPQLKGVPRASSR